MNTTNRDSKAETFANIYKSGFDDGYKEGYNAAKNERNSSYVTGTFTIENRRSGKTLKLINYFNQDPENSHIIVQTFREKIRIRQYIDIKYYDRILIQRNDIRGKQLNKVYIDDYLLFEIANQREIFEELPYRAKEIHVITSTEGIVDYELIQIIRNNFINDKSKFIELVGKRLSRIVPEGYIEQQIYSLIALPNLRFYHQIETENGSQSWMYWANRNKPVEEIVNLKTTRSNYKSDLSFLIYKLKPDWIQTGTVGKNIIEDSNLFPDHLIKLNSAFDIRELIGVLNPELHLPISTYNVIFFKGQFIVGQLIMTDGK